MKAGQWIATAGDGLQFPSQAFTPAITEIGELFSRGLKFLSELIPAAGAPVSQRWPEIIGDGAYADDTHGAAAAVKRFLG